MKKLLCLLLLVSLCFSKGFAQNIDSLKLALKNAKNDTTRCNILNAMVEAENDDKVWPIYNEQLRVLAEKNCKTNTPNNAFYLKHLASALNNIGFLAGQNGDNSKALEYYYKSLKIQKEINDKEGIAYSLNNIGVIYDNQGDIPKAIEYYKKGLKIQVEIGDKKGIAYSLNNIGFIYNNQGDISKALEYFHKSLQLQEELKDKVGIALSLNNFGLIYNSQGDISKALEYFHKSLLLQEELKDKYGIASSLNNIGAIYCNQGDNSKALEYHLKSLHLREELKDKQGIAESLNNIGGIFDDKGDISKALEYYHNSLQLREELKDKQGMATSLANIADVMLKIGQADGALDFAKRSLQVAKEIGYPWFIKNAASTLKNIYKKQNNYAAALEMYELEILMKDSINNKETQKASVQQQAKYEYEKQKAIDDVENEKLVAIEQEAKAKQKVITYATAGGLGLIAIFLIFVFNRLQVTKKQKNIIEQQKEIVEEKHKEITDSINYAERIQRSFLATTEMLDQHLKDYFVFFRPKDVVSGDFYWAGELNNGNFAFSVADSTGHGVPGAIMSILNISSLEKSIEKEIAPDQILNKTRKIIIERLKKDGSTEGGKDGMDCSLLVINKDRTQLSFAAANNPVFILRPTVIASCYSEPVEESMLRQAQHDKNDICNDGYELIEFKPDKMPVGKHDNDAESFTLHTALLQKGDVIYALTDGFPDQFGGEKGKKYMIKNLKELLLQIAHLSMLEQEQKLAEEFDKWKGSNEQVDDVCIIGVRI